MANVLKRLFILLFAMPAWCQAYSYFIPQGQREALMGNVGISLPSSEGAPIYNPASAAGLSSDRISASGSLLNVTSTKMGNESSFRDKSTSPSFSQIPGLITGYNKTSWGNVGFFINTDYMLSFDKLFAYNETNFTGYTEYEASLNSLNIGVIFANSAEFTKTLQLHYGITASLNSLEIKQSIFSKTHVPTGNIYTGSFDNTNSKSTNVLTRLGLLLKDSSYSVGTYYQPQGSVMTSSYSKFAYSVSSNGTVYDESTNTGNALTTPTNYGLGASINLKSTRILLDINIVEGSIEDQTGEEDIKKDRTEAVGLGLEQALQSGNNIYAGVSYSKLRSENPSDIWLVSGGFDYKISFIRNYFGAYYSAYKSPPNAQTNSSGSTVSYAGIILASQYSF
ncbi:hypothetical protein [Bdellovibrio sp. HCB337]|uniref:hypothetical protein n=1 Tax=Bdellovibrio sp. HCB337 TaxID=3394358 RepID=UPI0039A4CF93